MPWDIRPSGDLYCVYVEGSDEKVACHPTMQAAQRHLAALYANAGEESLPRFGDGPDRKELTAEIFAVGTWNGMEFSSGDLDDIVRAFNSLTEYHKVPLKFGHNDEQPLTDGHPALGWVASIWRSGEKLMARFTDVPRVVMDAVRNKLYRKVSIELDFGVRHKGFDYPLVLSGVALLGADIPAVSTLADLTAFMGRDPGVRSQRRAAFSSIAGNLSNQSEEAIMPEDIKTLTERLDSLTAQFAKSTDERKALERENAELRGKVEHFERKAQEEASAAAKAKTDAKRKEITDVVEAAVKAGTFTPAQRTALFKMLRIEDDAAVAAVDIEQVKDAVHFKAAPTKGAEHADAANDTGPSDALVAQRCAEIVSRGEAKDYFTAQRILFTREPNLARAYINREEIH